VSEEAGALYGLMGVVTDVDPAGDPMVKFDGDSVALLYQGSYFELVPGEGQEVEMISELAEDSLTTSNEEFAMDFIAHTDRQSPIDSVGVPGVSEHTDRQDPSTRRSQEEDGAARATLKRALEQLCVAEHLETGTCASTAEPKEGDQRECSICNESGGRICQFSIHEEIICEDCVDKLASTVDTHGDKNPVCPHPKNTWTVKAPSDRICDACGRPFCSWMLNCSKCPRGGFDVCLQCAALADGTKTLKDICSMIKSPRRCPFCRGSMMSNGQGIFICERLGGTVSNFPSLV